MDHFDGVSLALGRDRGEFVRLGPRILMVLHRARQLAAERGSAAVEPGHLLLPMLDQLSSVVPAFQPPASPLMERARAAIEATLSSGHQWSAQAPIPVADSTTRALEQAHAEADALGTPQVETSHLLIALYDGPPAGLSAALDSLNLSAAALRSSLRSDA